MKKLVSLMLVVLMALTCSFASAQTYTANVTIDRDQAATLAYTFGVPEEQLEMVDTVLAVLNAIVVNVVTADNSAQLDISLNGADAFSLAFSQDDSGIAVASTLFPNYVVTVSQETLGQVLQQIAANMPTANGEGGMDADAVGKLFAGYVTRFMEACSAAGKPGDPVTVDYEYDGHVFDTMIPITVDIPAITEATSSLVDEMLADEAAMAALEGYLKAQGKELKKEDIKAAIDEWMAHFPESSTAEFYCNSDGSEAFYLEGLSAMPDKEEPYVTYYMLYEDAANMLMGCTVYGDQLIDMAFMMEGQTMSMSFTMDDVYVGLTIDYSDNHFSFGLYFMDTDEPLVSGTILFLDGGEISLTTDTNGKTVVTAEDIMAGGDGMQDLVKDVTSNGLMTLLGAAAAVPELGNLMGSGMFAA